MNKHSTFRFWMILIIPIYTAVCSTLSYASLNLTTGSIIYFNASNSQSIDAIASGGDTAVIYSPDCGNLSSSACPVLVYQFENGVWVLSARLDPPSDQTSSTNSFGGSLAVTSDGDTVFVGDASAACSASASETCGAIDVYQRPATGWTDMTPTAVLVPPGINPGNLGMRLLVSGNMLAAVGTSPCLLNSGSCAAIYLFTQNSTGWINPTNIAVLTSPYYFGVTGGAAVSIYGTTLAATFGANDIYVFTEGANGWTSGGPTATLTSNDFGDLGRVGNSVSISGNIIVAGAPAEGAGTILVYSEPSGGWQDMSTETADLTASDAVIDQVTGLGTGVQIDGGTIVATASRSALYVFQEPAGGWVSGTESSQINLSMPAGGPVLLNGSSLLVQSAYCATQNPLCTAAQIFGTPAGNYPTPGLELQGNVDFSSQQQAVSPIPVVLAGKYITYDFEVTDLGPYQADNTIINFPLVDGVTNVGLPNGGTCANTTSSAACPAGLVINGQTIVVPIVVKSPATRMTFNVSAYASASEQNWDVIDAQTSVQAISDNPPIAGNASFFPTTGQVLAAKLPGSDVDNDTLTYTIVDQPSVGTLSLDQSNGDFTWTPPSSNFIGTVTFIYQASDGLLESQPGTININAGQSQPGSSGNSAAKGGGGMNFLLLGLLAVLASLKQARYCSWVKNLIRKLIFKKCQTATANARMSTS